MHKLFSIFLFFCIGGFCHSQESKIGRIELILEKSRQFEDIEKIIPIIKKYPHIYTFVPFGSPIKEKDKPSISSSYGYRIHPIDKTKKFHSGIDFKSKYATIIYATADGIVIFAGKKSGYGKCVIIKHKYGFSTLYGHMTLFYTKKDKKIKKGDAIGFVGSTGKSTGDHLHYEVIKNDIKINPTKWITQ